jgi:hypothetical protein
MKGGSKSVPIESAPRPESFEDLVVKPFGGLLIGVVLQPSVGAFGEVIGAIAVLVIAACGLRHLCNTRASQQGLYFMGLLAGHLVYVISGVLLWQTIAY